MLLPKEIASLVGLCNDQPENEGLFDALLSLLQNASDSAIVVEALKSLPREALMQHEASCRRAAELLELADEPVYARNWYGESKPEDESLLEATNVVFIDREAEEAVVSVEPEAADVVKMDDIAGLQDLKKQIYRKIVKPLEKPSLYEKFKRRTGGGLLMYGPPGCGKTLIAKAVAYECKAHFIEIRASEILDKYVGIAEKRIENVFAKARATRPSVLFFDEVEALAHRRNYSGSGTQGTLVSTMLFEMDGASQDNDGLLLLGATNVPWSIDPAFKRPGRFDRTLFVPPPDKVARKYLLQRSLAERPTAEDLNIKDLVEKTGGFSGADLEALIEAAVDLAIDCSSDEHIEPVTNGHFVEALREIQPSIGEWLGLARGFVEYGNQNGQYDDLKKFLRKFG